MVETWFSLSSASVVWEGVVWQGASVVGRPAYSLLVSCYSLVVLERDVTVA